MIQPQSVTLLPRGTQKFVSEPAAAEWALSQELGEINGDGVYKAPRNAWISQTVDVIARAGGQEIGRASVTVSSAKSWMRFLSWFWALLSVGLLVLLFRVWPPPVAPPAVEVYPPVVTLQTGDSLQFLSSARGSGATAVAWTAGDGQITPSGVFTAPGADAHKPIAVSATRASDRTQTATAQVYLHARKLVMERSFIDASKMAAGSRIELRAIGPAGAEMGLRWYLSGPGHLDQSGVYTLREQSAVQAIITAVDPAGGRQAAAAINLLPASAADDSRLLWLVLIMGAFGALLGAMRSFVNFVGSRTFVPSWGLYYLSRPVFGAGLALIVFFAYRIGAISGPQGGTPADPATAAFVAGMVGLFADTVLQKLHEVILQLFQPANARTDKMAGDSPAPNIAALAVNQEKLIITGANFAAGLTVSVNGSGLDPSAITPTQLAVPLPPTLAAAGTKLNVLVTSADGVSSAPMSVVV